MSSFTDAEPLYAGEHSLVVGWSPLRQAEFRCGRATARRVLAALGAAACPIPFDVDGVPCWPHGFVGSISHKRGFCLAAATRGADFMGIGVDLERETVLGASTNEICTPDEAQRLAELGDQCAAPLTLVLAAKEAAYKCQYPLTRTFLAWRDVFVTFGEGLFTASIGNGASPAELRGAFAVANGWIATVVVASTAI